MEDSMNNMIRNTYLKRMITGIIDLEKELSWKWLAVMVGLMWLISGCSPLW